MTAQEQIPFSKPYSTGSELKFLEETLVGQHWQGGGPLVKECENLLATLTSSNRHLLTHSCTGALEMIPLLLALMPGDEVIMPSYTFVSTANAFVRCGAVPVFVDIDKNTKNLCPNNVEHALTRKTRAVVTVNYGGICAPLDELKLLTDNRKIPLIEDAAQSIGSTYKGKPLGSFAPLSTFSFHATKNIAAGECGSLAINDPKYLHRAEIILEKGTNRTAFIQGETDKYTWVDVGSSFLPSEFTAAVLKAQLACLEEINSKRMTAWSAYHSAFEALEQKGVVERMYIPNECEHNAHLYYLLLRDLESRNRFLSWMRKHNIQATFHYVPLHSAPAGKKFGKTSGSLSNTNSTFERLVRLPLFPGVPHERVIDAAIYFFERVNRIPHK